MKNPFSGDLKDGIETGTSISEINRKFIIETNLQDRYIRELKFSSFLGFLAVMLMFSLVGFTIFGSVYKVTEHLKTNIVEGSK